jgi:hypothetical protein
MWKVEVVIPTYAIGDPGPNPILYFGKASQGAQGRVYPCSLYDSLTFKKVNKKYRFVHLENEFVRIGILPEVAASSADFTAGVDVSWYKDHNTSDSIFV